MKYERMTSLAKQQGLSLIEIMVALTVSLILMAGVLQIFLSSKQSYKTNDGLSRVQEAGRFSLETLIRDVRLAGFQGCANPAWVDTSTPVTNAAPTANFNLRDSALRGFNAAAGGAWSPAFPTDFTTNVALVPGSDILAVQHGSSIQASVLNTSSTTKIDMQSNPDGLAASTVALVTDCSSADVFSVSSIAGNSITPDITLSHAYGTQGSTATVMRLESYFYFVGNTGRTGDDGQPIRSLYRRTVDGATEELIEGVENMQVLYGQKSGANIQYLPADDAALNLSQVVSVQIAVLVSASSASRDTDDNTVYTLLDDCVGPPDNATCAGTYAANRRLRQVFTTTISLRNRQDSI